MALLLLVAAGLLWLADRTERRSRKPPVRAGGPAEETAAEALRNPAAEAAIALPPESGGAAEAAAADQDSAAPSIADSITTATSPPDGGDEAGAVSSGGIQSHGFTEFGRAVSLLSGRVLDDAGRPIAGAAARLGNHEAITDRAGEFILPESVADLVIAHPDHFPRTLPESARRQLARASFPGGQSRLLVVLFRGGRILGSTISDLGFPLQGVEARFSQLKRAASGERAVAISDAEGRFRSPLLAPGTHHVHFQHPDFQSWDTTVTVPASGGETSMEAVLREGALMTLTVLAAAGAPAARPAAAGLPDAQVWLITRSGAHGVDESRYLGRTGDRGILELRYDPDAAPRVRILLPGYRELERAIHGASQEIVLKPAPMAQGLAIDERSGLPAALVDVQLESLTPGGPERAPDRGVLFETLKKGHFRVGLPPRPGRYRVVVHGEDSLFGASDAMDFDGVESPPELRVRLEPRGGLDGVVLFQGAPRAGVRVELYPPEDAAALRDESSVEVTEIPPQPLQTQVTSENGAFRFQDLASGRFSVRARHPDFAELHASVVEVPAPAPLVLELERGASLRGRILNPDGSPAIGVPLVLSSEDRRWARSGRSDDGGNYEFPRLPDGDYRLSLGDASAAGGVDGVDGVESRALRIERGRDASLDVHLKEPRWGAIAGSVRADGRPLADALVRIAGPEGPSAREREIRGDERGAFRLFGLSPGVYRLRYGPTGTEHAVEVRSDKVAVCDLELRRRAVRLALASARTGKPPAVPVEIEVAAEAGGPPLFRETAGGGGIELRLHPGAYKLSARAKGFVPEERRLEVPEENAPAGSTRPEEPAPLEHRIDLRPGTAVRVTLRKAALDASAAAGAEEEPVRGLAEVVLLQGDVVVYRNYGPVDGEIVLPTLEPGSYHLRVHGEQGRASARFEVLAPSGEPDAGAGAGEADPDAVQRLEVRWP